MFNARTNKTGKCWIWVGGRLTNGYGTLKFGGRKGKLFLAHRISYELHTGIIPQGLCVLHKCDIPQCVNPDHLFLGTRTDNMIDKVSKERQSFTPGQRGSDSPNAKLSDADVSEIRCSYRPRKISAESLARKFGVHKRTILRVIHGISYAPPRLGLGTKKSCCPTVPT